MVLSHTKKKREGQVLLSDWTMCSEYIDSPMVGETDG